MTKERLEMRIRRLKRRVARLGRWLAAMKRWDGRIDGLLGPFIKEILDEDPEATAEEIIRALAEKVDELARFEGLNELITDAGITIVAEVAVWCYQNREHLVEERIKRLKTRIRNLDERLAQLEGERDATQGRSRKKTVARRPAAQDERAIFLALGMDAAFLEPAQPSPRAGAKRTRRAPAAVG